MTAPSRVDRTDAQIRELNVYTTDLGEEGVDLGKLYDYDIYPPRPESARMSGYDVLKQLRVSKIKTPILILSGLAGIEDKVKASRRRRRRLHDQPFHKDELVARIHATCAVPRATPSR